MDETILAEQRELVALLDDAGWTVSDAEVSVYQSPWSDDDAAEATVTLTARKEFPDLAAPKRGEDQEDDESPFRIG